MKRCSQSIYKVVSETQWRSAEKEGVFRGSAIDLQDGFIHLSSGAQVTETVAKHFAGQTGLLLVEVDAMKLGNSLRWEVSRNDERFPHVYGDIPISAAIRVDPLPLGDDGRHCFPE